MLPASHEREPLAWPHAHGSRVSRTTVSPWITKKELSFLPDIQPSSPRMRRMSPPRCWNWTTCGRLCETLPTTAGCGWPCAARREKLVAYAVGDRSRQDVSTGVGGHHRQLSCWLLRNVFLGSLSGSDPGGTAHRWRMRKQGKPLV